MRSRQVSLTRRVWYPGPICRRRSCHWRTRWTRDWCRTRMTCPPHLEPAWPMLRSRRLLDDEDQLQRLPSRASRSSFRVCSPCRRSAEILMNNGSRIAWPDVWIKSGPIFSKVAQKLDIVVLFFIIFLQCHKSQQIFWATYVGKFVAINFEKLPNLVTLVHPDWEGQFLHQRQKLFVYKLVISPSVLPW